MIWGYISVAILVFKRNFVHSLINIGGLAVGMSACFLIILYIDYEFSFDHQFTDYDRIYRVEQSLFMKGSQPYISPYLSIPGSEALESFGPPIEAKTSMLIMSRIVRYKEVQDFERIAFMEANFFDVLDFSSMIHKPKRAFVNTTSIMLSEKMAKKYFSDEDPIGKILSLDNKVDYEVVGVFPDLPKNIHIAFNFYVLLDKESDITQVRRMDWVSLPSTYTYIILEEGVKFTDIAGRLDEFLQNGAHKVWPRDGKMGFKYGLTPLTDIHLYSKYGWGRIYFGAIKNIITFGIITIFILSIACINYINLTTSRAMQRAREVGMRKVLGATRRQLMVQFLLESVLITSVAACLSIIPLGIILPWFTNFLNKEIELNIFTNYMHGSFVIGVVVIVGIIGGLYPAFVLSSFHPARVMSTNQSTATDSSWFRNSLVVLQYTVSIALIIATILVYEQTNFARQFDLGFNTEHKLNISLKEPDAQPRIETLTQKFSAIPGITSYAMMGKPFPNAYSVARELSIPKFAPEGGQRVLNYDVDYHFFQLFEIEAIAGRVFSPKYQGDSYTQPYQQGRHAVNKQSNVGSIVVNESFLHLFGIPDPETAIGESVYIERSIEVIIVGVVKDLLFGSVHNQTRPGFFSLRPEKELGAITLAIESNNLKATIQEIDRVWKEVVPNVPIARRFVDTIFNNMYFREERKGRLFSYFALLAIVLSCLGLYGLSSFTVSRRKKEIGIRKAVGASVWDIVLLLLFQFAIPVLIAGVVGLPIAAIFINNWLQGFAYRISLYDYAYLFPVVLLAALIIAWMTVLFHTVLAARTKPFVSLRTE
jgi:putative ABC transport system permease protein